MVRRSADRALYARVSDLETQSDRRKDDDGGHLRRRTIRHNCEVSISIKVGHTSGFTDTWTYDHIKIPGRILDLSEHGCAVFTQQSFETGQELQLVIKLRNGAEIGALATIRWVKSADKKGGNVSGAQFSQVAEKDVRKLTKFLKELDASLGL